MRVDSVPSVFAGSPARRPLNMICGNVAEFDFVYVIAMSPAWSMASAGWKRKFVFAASGSNVASCRTFAATLPPVTSAWYQRTVAFPPVTSPQDAGVPRCTVCATHSDSTPPWFSYCAAAIARIWRTSAALFGVSAFETPEFDQQSGVAGVNGPVNVDVVGLSQLTWNLYTENAFRKSQVETKY